MTADPDGKMEIRADLGAMLRYKFESRATDYILCNRCGSYVAQVMEDPNTNVAVGLVNVNCLDDQEAFQQPATRNEPMVETVAMRREKRSKTWTPCSFMR
jgi:hypothetical protein